MDPRLRTFILEARRRASELGPLFSGNCGTFAIALGCAIRARFPLAKTEIVLLTNAPDFIALEDGDAEVYHVVLLVDGQIVDGDGIWSGHNLPDWIVAECCDPSPFQYRFEVRPSPDDLQYLQRLICGSTSYTIGVADFLRAINGR